MRLKLYLLFFSLFFFLFYTVCNLVTVYTRSHVFMWGQVIGASSCISILRSFFLNFKPDQRDHRGSKGFWDAGCIHLCRKHHWLSFPGEWPLNSWHNNFTESEKRNKYLSFKVFLHLPPTVCLKSAPAIAISDPALCPDSSYGHVLFCLSPQQSW